MTSILSDQTCHANSILKSAFHSEVNSNLDRNVMRARTGNIQERNPLEENIYNLKSILIISSSLLKKRKIPTKNILFLFWNTFEDEYVSVHKTMTRIRSSDISIVVSVPLSTFADSQYDFFFHRAIMISHVSYDFFFFPIRGLLTLSLTAIQNFGYYKHKFSDGT